MTALFCLVLLDVSAAPAQQVQDPQVPQVQGPEYGVKAGFIYNFAKYVEWPCGTFKNDKTLRLCIVSDDPEADIFFSLNNKMIGKKRVIVRKEKNICLSDDHTDHDHPHSDPSKILSTIRSIPSKIIPGLGHRNDKEEKHRRHEQDEPRRGPRIYNKVGKNAENKTGQDNDRCDCHILFISSTDEKHIRKRLGAVKNQSVLTVGQTKGFAKKMGGVINFFTEGNSLRFQVNADAAKRAGLKFRAQLMMSAEVVREEP